MQIEVQLLMCMSRLAHQSQMTCLLSLSGCITPDDKVQRERKSLRGRKNQKFEKLNQEVKLQYMSYVRAQI